MPAMKIRADKRMKIVKKPAIFHNVYLRFFYPKNTISCVIFSLQAGYIVAPENQRKYVFHARAN
jgi:hypothetical protein